MQDFFNLIRWKNLVFLALVMWMLQRLVIIPLMIGYGFEPADMLHGMPLAVIIIATVLIAAGGYVINDYFDVKIDAINNPDNQIVSKTITREQAMRIYQILTVSGVAVGIYSAVMLKSWSIGLLMVFMPGLLWFYSSSYKRMLIVGNLIVALSAALVPILLAMADIAYIELTYTEDLLYQTPIIPMIYKWLSVFALFAFLLTFSREIVKDLEDQIGDRELECHTIPVVFGETWSKVIVMLLMLFTIGLLGMAYMQWIPFDKGWASANMNYMLCYAVLWVIAIVIFLRSHRASDYAVSSSMLKILMGWGMIYTLVFYIQECQLYNRIIF